MQINDEMIRYESIVDTLVSDGHEELARALINMGVPYKMVLADPYFAKHYGKWVRNATENYPVILGQSKRRKVCFSQLPESSKPAMVIGSGYSLNGALRALQEWKGDIICGNSNVFTLLANGIVPKYLCVYDSHPEVAKLLTSYKHWPASVHLITHPTINPLLVRKWRGPVSYYLVRRAKMELFDIVFPAMYAPTGIERGMTWRICVVNNEVQVAGALGTPGRTIFLTGCDFGWMDMAKHRCRTYRPSAYGHQLVERDIASITPDRAELSMDERGWWYSGDMIILRDELYKMWWENHLSVVDCSGGSLVGFPTARIEDVVACQGAGYEWVYEKRREHAKVIADYLNHRVAVKQEQYRKIVEARNETGVVGDSTGGGDTAAVGGGDSRTAGQAGPGA